VICPFYGYAALPNRKVLVSSGGNQCALITDAHAPCRMEQDGQHPELEHCIFNGTGHAIDYAQFERHVVSLRNGSSDYPD
jgi:hypothetical protein